MSEVEQVPVGDVSPQMPPAPSHKPIFVARPGFSADFSDIKPPAEPNLGLDEALGVRWVRLRGKICGIRFGTLRQRRAMERQLEVIQGDGLGEDEQYREGLGVFQSLLVMPDPASTEGVRPMTIEEMEERIDLVDFAAISQLAFPVVSPLQALIDAGANPN